MKKILFLLAILFIIIGSSCNKNNNDPEPKYKFRLTKFVTSREGLNDMSIDFRYEGDQVTGWKDTDGAGTEFNVMFKYLENNVVETTFVDSNNVESGDKFVYTFNGELLEKFERYNKVDGEFVLLEKTTYQYNQNGDVTETIKSSFIGGIEQQETKNVFSYDNNLLAEVIDHYWIQNTWKKTLKKNFHYENGLLVLLTGDALDNNAWVPFYKDEFTYPSDDEGVKVSEISKYVFISEDNWSWLTTNAYQYDNNGNMISEEVTSSSNDNWTYTYTYEEKSGNLWLFNINKEYGYPQPFYKSKNQILPKGQKKAFLFKD